MVTTLETSGNGHSVKLKGCSVTIMLFYLRKEPSTSGLNAHISEGINHPYWSKPNCLNNRQPFLLLSLVHFSLYKMGELGGLFFNGIFGNPELS